MIIIVMMITITLIIKNSNIFAITSERSEGEKLFPATRIPVSSPNWNGTQPWPYRDCNHNYDYNYNYDFDHNEINRIIIIILENGTGRSRGHTGTVIIIIIIKL